MPCLTSIAFSNSFSPRNRAISSSCFFLSNNVRLSVDCDAFSCLNIQILNKSIQLSSKGHINYSQVKTKFYLDCCFCCSICTYSQAFDRMPPLLWPSIAAMLKRPLSPISVGLPSAGIMFPNFMIQ